MLPLSLDDISKQLDEAIATLEEKENKQHVIVKPISEAILGRIKETSAESLLYVMFGYTVFREYFLRSFANGIPKRCFGLLNDRIDTYDDENKWRLYEQMKSHIDSIQKIDQTALFFHHDVRKENERIKLALTNKANDYIFISKENEKKLLDLHKEIAYEGFYSVLRLKEPDLFKITSCYFEISSMEESVPKRMDVWLMQLDDFCDNDEKKLKQIKDYIIKNYHQHAKDKISHYFFPKYEIGPSLPLNRELHKLFFLLTQEELKNVKEQFMKYANDKFDALKNTNSKKSMKQLQEYVDIHNDEFNKRLKN